MICGSTLLVGCFLQFIVGPLEQCHRRCPHVLWRQQAPLVSVSHFLGFLTSYTQSRQSDLDPMGGIIVRVHAPTSSNSF